MEIWKDVTGYEGLYLVSPCGKIKSSKSGKLLMGSYIKYNYRQVALTKDKSVKMFLVHRLVAFAYIRKTPGKDYVNHIDSNPSNNSVSNLEWCTASENTIHAHKYGNFKDVPRRNLGKCSKLSDDQVKYIRSLPKSSVNINLLCNLYGITRRNMEKLIKNQSYKWVI